METIREALRSMLTTGPEQEEVVVVNPVTTALC